jgi:hypothetical protein
MRWLPHWRVAAHPNRKKLNRLFPSPAFEARAIGWFRWPTLGYNQDAPNIPKRHYGIVKRLTTSLRENALNVAHTIQTFGPLSQLAAKREVITMGPTGHIRERSPGSWELRYSLGRDPATGKRRIATATVRGSRRDAVRELAAYFAH